MIIFNFIQIFQRRKESEETRLSQEISQGFKKKNPLKLTEEVMKINKWLGIIEGMIPVSCGKVIFYLFQFWGSRELLDSL